MPRHLRKHQERPAEPLEIDRGSPSACQHHLVVEEGNREFHTSR